MVSCCQMIWTLHQTCKLTNKSIVRQTFHTIVIVFVIVCKDKYHRFASILRHSLCILLTVIRVLNNHGADLVPMPFEMFQGK